MDARLNRINAILGGVMLVGKRALSVLYSFLVHQCRPGDWFILPVNICPSVYWCFVKARIRVVFCDIDNESLCIDLVKARTLARGCNIRGLLFNHTYGCPFYPEKEILEFRRENDDCLIVDDRCLCIPEVHQDRVNTDSSDLTLFSTGYAKCVDLGYGGYGFLSARARRTELIALPYLEDDEKLIEAKFKERGMLSQGEIFRMQWLDGAVDFDVDSYLRSVLAKTVESVEHKNKLNAIYYQKLSGVRMLDADYNIWRFNILVESPERLVDSLFEQGLFASRHYNLLEGPGGRFPVADALSKSVVNLFNDRYFTEEQALRCSKIINTVSQFCH